MRLLKINEDGRSMIEMLGVLAIVGILSVGGIAGFSKAMFKYKLNKAIEQYNIVFDLIVTNTDKWQRIKTNGQEYSMLSELWISMDILPNEMIKKQNDTLYDAFVNPMFVRKYSTYIDFNLKLNSKSDSNYSMNKSNICQAVILNALYPRHAELKQILLLRGIGGVDDVSSKYHFYGDSYCDDTKRNCLRDLTISDVTQICEECEDDKLCRIVAHWPL